VNAGAMPLGSLVATFDLNALEPGDCRSGNWAPLLISTRLSDRVKPDRRDAACLLRILIAASVEQADRGMLLEHTFNYQMDLTLVTLNARISVEGSGAFAKLLSGEREL